MPSKNSLSCLIVTALGGMPSLVLLPACNPAGADEPGPQITDTAAAPAGSGAGVNPQRSTTDAPASSGLADSGNALAAPAATVATSCSSSRVEAELIRQSVDIIVVMDNSGSMSDEAGAVEANLNVNFAQTLANSGIDYRLILISRHRSSEAQRTSACITRPLSGLAECPADQPAFGERFFQYSVEVGSHDSLSLLLDTYDGTHSDEFDLAPRGWSEWLRADAKKIFLEISDDDSRVEAARFLSDLTSFAPEQFAADRAQAQLVWHSIIGLAEKDVATEPYFPAEPVQDSRCSGNDVSSEGATYQDLSRLTGGLRFPICQFDGYDRVFQAIADDVASSSQLACAFAIPAPPAGQRLELDKVAVAYTPGDGAGLQTLGQVTDPSKCGDDAFLIAGAAISLCPQACAKIRADARSALDVVFSCASALILR